MQKASGKPKYMKKAVNLSLSADLLREARALDINLSQLLEERLIETVREAKEKAWREDNRQAIEEYNALVAERGSFGDRHRRF
ncbi:MAG: type II toxin-antitoxin system CcdA family antitoxin [Nitrococcus sp.]|nr:type II toxin-antitoxin system CcdA family antitoxin [Nitrococcus sp.]